MAAHRFLAGRYYFVACFLLLFSFTTLYAATPEQVDAAINKAKQFIYSRQNAQGNWEVPGTAGDNTVHFSAGGQTAMALYALLASHDNYQLPPLTKALNYLTTVKSQGMYGVGVRCQVWNQVPMKKVAKSFTRDLGIILHSLRTKGEAAGLYHYVYVPNAADYDHSVSQYGVLGAWACADADLTVPATYWTAVDRAWRRHQNADGSWNYTQGPGCVTMTSAGVATLFLARDFGRAREGINCTGNVIDANIEKGIAWMGAHFNEVFGNPAWNYYGLYGIERIGVASGYKYFGKVNWFDVGADWLVRTQAASGYWNVGPKEAVHTGPVVNTAFSLLFLIRGRAPVVMNKLAYNIIDPKDPRKVVEGHWCERPRDVANFTRWFSKQTEKDLNWQVVGLDNPVEEWHDAPILYISGNQALNFPNAPVVEAKLRQYVEEGGLILLHSDGGSDFFNKSAKKLAGRLYPHYEFRTLEKNHPIYTEQAYRADKWGRHPKVMGLTNGVRELMILIPDADPARAWQLRAYDIDSLFELPADIFLYVAEVQSLLTKGHAMTVKPNPAINASGKITVRRLKYSGNWDPEPGGWKRLAALMHNNHMTDLDIKTIELGKGQLGGGAAAGSPEQDLRKQALQRIPADQVVTAAADPAKLESLIKAKVAEIQAEQKAAAAHPSGLQFAHLTGTGDFKFDESQSKEIKAFVENKGLLLIDAAGGSADFTTSAENEMCRIFDVKPADLQVLPAGDAIYSTGGALGPISYRVSARKTVGSSDVPRIKALMLNGRPAVLISPDDLSNGLVGMPVDGVIGCTPADAIKIVTRILLYVGK